MNEALVANKWYSIYKKPSTGYPSPQSILRAAVGAQEYMFLSETVTTEHIRAAVVMPLDVPFQHLLSSVPWGMSYRTESWRMIIVSVLDSYAWIELARASGALGWMKNHNKSYTYNWEPPPLDQHGLKFRAGAGRPTNEAMDARGAGRPKKYDRDLLLEDLRMGEKTHGELATKHGISRISVLKLAQKNGLSKGRHYVTT
jgi:hypothetical protein